MLAGLAIAGCERSPSPSPSPPPPSEEPQRLPTVKIRVGDVPLEAELAREERERQKGMMFRPHLAPDEAMLFIFDRDENLAFWMKNTYVDLDLAYIRSDGTIVQVERLKAHDLTSVYSREPARFALEVPPGWFEAHGIKVGDRVSIPPEALAPGR
jgi:hypothetical protein